VLPQKTKHYLSLTLLCYMLLYIISYTKSVGSKHNNQFSCVLSRHMSQSKIQNVFKFFIECAWCLCPLLIKLLPSQQILIKVSNIKHHGNVSSRSSADTCKHLAREKIIYDKANMTKNLILCASELKIYKKGKNSMY